MTSPAVHFNFIAVVGEVFYQLETTTHSGFPVTNETGRPVGIIERDVLITLIEKQCWYDKDSTNGSPALLGAA